MDVYEFGKALIETKDLDPVYVGLVGADLDPSLLKRVCLAYWCFYHLGAACYIAEKPKEFWNRMHSAADNDAPNPRTGGRWPRAAERRHFRGAQAIMAVHELHSGCQSPEGIVNRMYNSTYEATATAVKQHRGFGPWIAWKVADMMERVLGYPVDFSNADLGIYKDPRQGAALIATGDWKTSISNAQLSNVVEELTHKFRKFKAPPYNDRPINVQEVETVLCKFKSHYKGHYEVGKDIREVRHGLVGWGRTAERVLENMPCEL